LPEVTTICRVPGKAIGTVSAVVERQHHVGANLDICDAGPQGLDHTGTLVSHDERECRTVAVPAGQDVCVAEAGSHDADEDFSVSRFAQLHLLDGEWGIAFAEHCGSDLHGVS
jgi:hypothetical protein